MTLAHLILLIGIVGPLAIGFAALFSGNNTSNTVLIQRLYMLASASGFIGAVTLLAQLAGNTQQPVTLAVPLLHSSLTLDGWAIFFLLLINLGSFLASWFSAGYLPKYNKIYSLPALNAILGLFLFSMQMTVLASSILLFLLCWELMSVAAYFLVIADREPDSFRAGFIYFVLTQFGVSCILGGFLILAHGDPFATFSSIATTVKTLSPHAQALAFFLLFTGFGSKAGLVPLHQWLPYAHPQAPSNASALMSGVMLKIAVYAFLRVSLNIFPSIPFSWAIVVTGIGLLSAFFGVLMAAVETNLKQLLAWSSIEHLGIIFTMIGIGFVCRSLNLPSTVFFVAALLHSLNHTIFKSGLFMAAGSIIGETHTRDIDDMGGLAKRWPAFSAAFLGLALAAAALPPLGTFYGEWLFLQQLAAIIIQISINQTLLFVFTISIMALVGGLALFAFIKTFASIFLAKPRSESIAHVHQLAKPLIQPIIAAAFLSLLVGIFAGPITGYIKTVVSFDRQPVHLTASLTSGGAALSPFTLLGILLLLTCVIIIVRWWGTSRRPIRLTDTWDCGQPITPAMEYTATGFAAPIRFFFRSLLLSRKELVSTKVVPENPWIVTRQLDWSITSVWEQWIYQPFATSILAAATWIKKLQNGIIQFYILLVLLTLIITLIFAV